MSLIRPFRGLRPADDYAAEMLAPPYDVLNSAEARARAAEKPWSFLHISKPEIDLPEGTDPYSAGVYEKAAENLDTMLRAGVLVRDPTQCYYVYRMRDGDHVQTGLVAVASIRAYRSNRIRKHENTFPAKEQDRVRQIEALNAQTGPVLMAYPEAEQLDATINLAAAGPPAMQVTADNAVEHSLWIVSEEERIRTLTEGFDKLPALYIADGHHRSAAATRVAAGRGGAADSPQQYFLSVIFPQREMQILDYNRLVKDLNGRSPDEFKSVIRRSYNIDAVASAVRPAKLRFGMYLPEQWYELSRRGETADPDTAGLVARLATTVLTQTILQPILGIADLRLDPRIEFVGGRHGLDELTRRVDSGEMAVGFSLAPTSMDELLAVADTGAIMPPKSTWFEPKLADGVVSHVLA